MGFFNNSKIQKSISLLLASLSIGGMGGCRKAEKKQIDEMPSESQVEKSEIDMDAQYTEKLKEHGVTIDFNNNNNESTENKTEKSIDKETELKKSITGITERDRLLEVLNQKDWGDREESLIIEMYDTVERNYDLRDIYNAKDKQQYLRNLVKTINNVNEIKIAPNDSMLLQNNWNARADYVNNVIVLKFENTCDLLHELDHMGEGTFLNGSTGVDLGFVFQEGSASAREGDAMKNTEWIDNIQIDVNKSGSRELMIYNCSGSYPAFEEIYKNFIELGIDMKKIREQEKHVSQFTSNIENELNNKYGNGLGTKYMESVDSYIEFFNMHGMVCFEENQKGQTVFEAREAMLVLLEKCMTISRGNQINRDMNLTR